MNLVSFLVTGLSFGFWEAFMMLKRTSRDVGPLRHVAFELCLSSSELRKLCSVAIVLVIPMCWNTVALGQVKKTKQNIGAT